MYKTFVFSLLGLIIAARCAPTPLDAATLLQNGEAAQTLNRQFETLKASDPCQDGQVACLGTKTIANCQGTSWETTLGQCSRSQNCFALPSVTSQGTHITCTSEKSAENLINSTGAKGGIFGTTANGTMETNGGKTMQYGSDTPSQTSSSVYAPTATSGLPSSIPVNPTLNIGDEDGEVTTSTSASHRPCTTHKPSIVSVQPTPTVAPDTAPSSASAPPVSTEAPPASPSADGTPERVTVTVTLFPSQPTTFAPQTRTVSPEEASSIIASIKAAGGTLVAPPAATSTAASSLGSSVSAGGYGGY
ncbi:hypothetical protein AN958_11957 [Leucoagaricus sp. SymC.cos]|nr:hypothetical protein AN958_11957 [Leucoagaricus sp. SymC.cos]